MDLSAGGGLIFLGMSFVLAVRATYGSGNETSPESGTTWGTASALCGLFAIGCLVGLIEIQASFHAP